MPVKTQQTVTDNTITVIKEYQCKKIKIFIEKGSIVDFSGDAIVNAASKCGLGGGGVDGALNNKGGKELRDARQKLAEINADGDRIKVGGAVVTPAGTLAAK